MNTELALVKNTLRCNSFLRSLGFACRFFKSAQGVKVQELSKGQGRAAGDGDLLELQYVLRRTNGYFIYSTVEGVSFQPKDIPTGPFEFKLVSKPFMH